MSFEEILEAEYGKGKVYIDYREDSNNVANIGVYPGFPTKAVISDYKKACIT